MYTVRRAFVTAGAGRDRGKGFSPAAEHAEAKTDSNVGACKKSSCFKVVVDPRLGSGRQRPKPKSERKAQRFGTQHLKIHSGSEVGLK